MDVLIVYVDYLGVVVAVVVRVDASMKNKQSLKMIVDCMQTSVCAGDLLWRQL